VFKKLREALYNNLYNEWVGMMNNHFGKGLMNGYNLAGPCPAAVPAKFCNDYIRGMVLGYCYQLEKKTGERKLAALEAGRLTRQYNLDKVIMSEFFTEFRSERFLHYFNIGYAGG